MKTPDLFESPGLYRIRVRGHIDDSQSQYLGGMVITRAFSRDNEPLSILVGQLQDQAALSGVLNELYDRRTPLITVEYVESQAGAH